MSGINHVFVDCENIKRIDPAVFEMERTTFTLLLGPQNRTLNVALVEQLIARGAVGAVIPADFRVLSLAVGISG